MSLPVHVVGAAIERDGRILCTQRGPGHQSGLWEFPGGKIEPGESAEEALQREIAEELSCEVIVGDEITTTTWHYDHATVILTTFRCTLREGDEPTLHEHAAAKWVRPGALRTIEWAPADVEAVAVLLRMMR